MVLFIKQKQKQTNRTGNCRLFSLVLLRKKTSLLVLSNKMYPLLFLNQVCLRLQANGLIHFGINTKFGIDLAWITVPYGPFYFPQCFFVPKDSRMVPSRCHPTAKIFCLPLELLPCLGSLFIFIF